MMPLQQHELKAKTHQKRFVPFPVDREWPVVGKVDDDGRVLVGQHRSGVNL